MREDPVPEGREGDQERDRTVVPQQGQGSLLGKLARAQEGRELSRPQEHLM